jgi:pyruvate/2-oxoglutarate dehydrogenase complex dihydrolipoamide dehydrogenase (E3) component
MSGSESVDVVVLGMGPGGEDVASRLAEAGLDVVGVEAELLGGECPYWGCVPSKMMIRAANLLAETRRVPGMAGQSSLVPDFGPVARRIREEATDDWDDTVAVDRFVGKGGTFVRGRGRLAGPGRVVVDGTAYTAARGVVVATGTRPSAPPVDGLAGLPYWTNREAISTTDVPASLLVLGGGAIGVELAQVFARFGSRVTVVEAAPRLVALEEPEASSLLEQVLRSEGLTVLTGATVTKARHDGTGFTLTVDGEDLTAERLLVATGRHVDVAALGVDTVGLDPTARFLDTDEHLRVRGAERLWAVGDVTGRGAFTHMAMYQSPIATASILGRDWPGASYDAVPRVTFTDPEIGAVGLTEAAARAQGLDVRVGSVQIPTTARGWIHKAGNDGFIKVVEDAGRGVLVGATSVGPVGGEVLAALVVAVHAQVPTEALRTMIYAYPTFHRGLEVAVGDLH